MTPVTQTLDSRCYVNEAHVSGGVPVMSRNVNDGKTAFYDAVPKREDGETRSGGWSPQDNRGRVPSGRTRLQNDHLGNTLAVLTEDGIDPVLSTPFGHSLDADPRPDRRFTGKPYDADLQAHVFPYRNYSTQTAAWTTADPAGFPDGPNRHFYAAVPTMGLDPLGLAIETVNSSSFAGVFPLTTAYVEVKFDITQGSSASISYLGSSLKGAHSGPVLWLTHVASPPQSSTRETKVEDGYDWERYVMTVDLEVDANYGVWPYLIADVQTHWSGSVIGATNWFEL